jgi:hypothetical protein
MHLFQGRKPKDREVKQTAPAVPVLIGGPVGSQAGVEVEAADDYVRFVVRVYE